MLNPAYIIITRTTIQMKLLAQLMIVTMILTHPVRSASVRHLPLSTVINPHIELSQLSLPYTDSTISLANLITINQMIE